MSNVQVSSTTDEVADIYRAAGQTPPKKADAEAVTAGSDKSISAIATPAAEEPSAEPASEPASENQDSEQKSEGVNRLQKRFDKLTRTIHEQRELIERLQRSVEERAPTHDAQEAEPEPPKKPTPEQYSTYEDYVEALTDWKTDRKLAEAKENFQQEQQARSQEQEFKKNLERYNSRLLEVRDMYDDFDEVFGSAEGEHPDYVRDAIIDSEYGPDIAYYLAKNPKEYQDIVNSSQVSALRKIGRIEHAITLQNEGATATTAQKATGSPARTSALRPTKPVGGTVKGTVPPDEMSYSEYRKWRDKQDKERYRR